MVLRVPKALIKTFFYIIIITKKKEGKLEKIKNVRLITWKRRKKIKKKSSKAKFLK